MSAFASTTKSHPETLNMALLHHFYRAGQFDLANTFQQEIQASGSILNGVVDTSLKVVVDSSKNIDDSETKEKYLKLHEICTQLRLGNLNPAIE